MSDHTPERGELAVFLVSTQAELIDATDMVGEPPPVGAIEPYRGAVDQQSENNLARSGRCYRNLLAMKYVPKRRK